MMVQISSGVLAGWEHVGPSAFLLEGEAWVRSPPGDPHSSRVLLYSAPQAEKRVEPTGLSSDVRSCSRPLSLYNESPVMTKQI